jgi:hypothetical protein
MIEHFYVGCYWKQRVEPLESCAKNMYGFLSALAAIHPLFSHWRCHASSLRKAWELEVSLTPEGISSLFVEASKKWMGLDSNNKQPCVNVALWNQITVNDVEGVTVRVSCNSVSEYVGNNCVLELPNTLESRLLDIDALNVMIKAMVHFFDPDHGRVSSDSIYQYLQSAGLSTDCGWLSYRKGIKSNSIQIKEPSQVIDIGDRGALFIATPQKFSLSDNNDKGALMSVANIVSNITKS